ncbi:MAG: UDP-N-acetylmuramoyl-tripeptide--D-alanyl-D-alanine ligase [Tannerellaceae bacterium]|jgi:UDP-N-acetylmuramoyl-tripeptide--D-alanyl-D-alanine ligase|nr:UDP-N-acetylmuramoyl-tripeptide--D-alanyl-D-alanine ligase [Tannerellaceae bacterium]
MDISELYSLFLHYPQITTDSRTCRSGSLFFAIKGKNFDGNSFAGQALAHGADYAVIDNAGYYTGERTVLVDDVLKTLQHLARKHRRMLGLPVIGITGTNGKTTTKELLAAVLSAKFNLLYTQGNLNNQLGVPLTLLRLTREHEMAVIEMGASRKGDIAELAEIAQPDYGIVTNVGRAHLEGFGSFDNVVSTKAELYDYIRRTGGVVFIKKESKELQAMAEGIEQVTYGTSDDAFASGHAFGNSPLLVFDWKQQGKVHMVETSLVGAYNLDNVMAAVCAGRYFKVPAERISRAIASYEPSNNRSQLKKTPSNSLIIDAYNANPDSMKAAISNFALMRHDGPRAVILGDMKELGSDSLRLHEEVIGEVEACGFDHVILAGGEFTRAAAECACDAAVYPSAESLTEALRLAPLKGFCILIKGSRGMEMEQVVEVL